MSNPSLMSVADMIEVAFGNPSENKVDFKLIQKILFILANHLRLLQRVVLVERGEDIKSLPGQPSQLSSKLSVTEVKVYAKKDGQKKSPDKLERPPLKSRKVGKTYSPKKKVPRAQENQLHELEEQREKELRVIYQRTDSLEEPLKEPPPMKTLDDPVIETDKILVVERIPKEGGTPSTKQSAISLATRQQYDELVEKVNILKEKLMPETKDYEDLMEKLQKGVPLSEALAALQLSARLEAVDKTLYALIELVSNLLKTENLSEMTKHALTAILTTVPHQTSHVVPTSTVLMVQVGTNPDFGPGFYVSADMKAAVVNVSARTVAPIPTALLTDPVTKLDKYTDTIFKPSPKSTSTELTVLLARQYDQREEESSKKMNYITREELDETLDAFHKKVLKMLEDEDKRIKSTNNNMVISNKCVESKIANLMEQGLRIQALENALNRFQSKVNDVQTFMSSQTGNFQEQLFQMQYDLEVAIDAMNEALANATGDPEAVAEMHGKFNSFRAELESFSAAQAHLSDSHRHFNTNLEKLMNRLELIASVKCDRDEVMDALSDKAGIKDLNGIVTQEEFAAVCGELERQILAAYDKFNSQEKVWQKAIEDFVRSLNEKADLTQLLSLHEVLQTHINDIKKQIKDLQAIVGEPRAAAVSRKLFMDTQCLSCCTPANFKMDDGKYIEEVQYPSQSKPKEFGEPGVCYPGFKIPFEPDPRAVYCKRFCGGRHTVTLGKMLNSQVVVRQINPPRGVTETQLEMPDPVPCKQCHHAPPTKKSEKTFKSTSDNSTIQQANQQDMIVYQLLDDFSR